MVVMQAPGWCERERVYIFGRTSGGRVAAFYCAVDVETGLGLIPALGLLKLGYGRLVILDDEGRVAGLWRLDVKNFTPACTPPVHTPTGPTRWWFAEGDVVLFGEAGGVALELSRLAITEDYQAVEIEVGWDTYEKSPNNFCKHVLGLKPGKELIGEELPVTRHPWKYLRVGKWLAWHRVLGVLDYNARSEPRRWVIIGDDGLYVAEFTATAQDPLEELGEVGYVRVVEPFQGDVDEVASPCGAPRLVACSEEGVRVGEAVLNYVRRLLADKGVRADLLLPAKWDCRTPSELVGIEHKPFILPGLTPADVNNWKILSWPLTDTCPDVLKAADGDPAGLYTLGIKFSQLYASS